MTYNNSNSFSNKKDFKIVEKAKIWFLIPLVILLIGGIMFGVFGFNLGIDFTGGTVIEISVGSAFEGNNGEQVKQQYKSDIEQVLKDAGLKISYYQQSGTGEETKLVVRYQDIKGKTEEQMEEISSTVVANLKTELSLSDEQIEQSQRIGATASSELLINCLLAILVAVILMLIYIGIRFELSFGISAIVALMHDVVIMCALMAIFQIQINSSFVAALITIIGYSINNTIVVFDRIRDNKKLEKYQLFSNAQIANISIKKTLTRTIYTTITTLFAIVILAIIGVSTIKEFALPIIFGLLAGTYSSIFVAGPLWAIINDRTVKRNSKAAKKLENNN